MKWNLMSLVFSKDAEILVIHHVLVAIGHQNTPTAFDNITGTP